MGDSAVNDIGACNASAHRLDTALDLGDHAARDDALLFQEGHVADGNGGFQRGDRSVYRHASGVFLWAVA